MGKQLFGTDGIRGIPGNIRWMTPLSSELVLRSDRIFAKQASMERAS